jgi:hypothetical protein
MWVARPRPRVAVARVFFWSAAAVGALNAWAGVAVLLTSPPSAQNRAVAYTYAAVCAAIVAGLVVLSWGAYGRAGRADGADLVECQLPAAPDPALAEVHRALGGSQAVAQVTQAAVAAARRVSQATGRPVGATDVYAAMMTAGFARLDEVERTLIEQRAAAPRPF